MYLQVFGNQECRTGYIYKVGKFLPNLICNYLKSYRNYNIQAYPFYPLKLSSTGNLLTEITYRSFYVLGVVTWVSITHFSAFCHLWEGHNVLARDGCYLTTPTASSVSAFETSPGCLGTCLFWCERFERQGRSQQVLATLFLTLINLCLSRRVWGFLPLTAAPWTVAKRMIELEKSREGSLCNMEESYPEEIEWSMCVYNYIDKYKLLFLRN